MFAEEKYAGNQLAVIICGKSLTDEEMQRIAKEMHFSETTFILSEKKREDGYDVRIFTPEVEVPFAGHPTLGTAYIVQSRIIKKRIKEVTLNLKVGQIPVLFDYSTSNNNILWMKQKEPTFNRTFEPQLIAKILSLDENDLDNKFLVQEVSTGLPFIIIPIKSLNAMKRVKINKEKYFDLVKETDAKALLLFCPETYSKKNNLNVRMFADYFGIPEDPATGSGNGCLAGYLVKYRYFNKNQINIRVEQGYEIGRNSLLFLSAEENGGRIKVNVGGKVILFAKGKLL